MRSILPILAVTLLGGFQLPVGLSSNSPAGALSVVSAAPSFLPKGSLATPAFMSAIINTKRHGDEEEEEEEEETSHSHSHSVADEHSTTSATTNTTTDTAAHASMHADEHSHSHHMAAPLKEINETEILLHHAPLPESYWDHDLLYGSDDPRLEGTGQYGMWMALHIASMVLSYFFILPVALALRTAHHMAYPASLFLFNVVQALGIFFVSIYNAGTPNLYEGNKHGSFGWAIIIMSWILTGVDFLSFLGGLRALKKGKNSEPIHKRVWKLISTGRGSANNNDDVHGYVIADAEEMGEDEVDGLMKESAVRGHDQEDHVLTEASQHHGWGQVNSHIESSRQAPEATRSASMSSSSTHVGTGPNGEHITNTSSKFAFAGSKWTQRRNNFVKFALIFLWRLMIVLAFAEFLMGIAVYSGTCRGNYLNGCLAHLIKGGIFFGYGVLTFGRFLGAWSELGWAWNAKPQYKAGNWRKNAPTAESVECFVIFLYGVSNTWMERFGAAPGSPLTVKQMQHISIAVMFWFAGLIGMCVESKRLRNFLSTTVAHNAHTSLQAISPKPPTWDSSFNPFPALCIGITGIAMAAHHQTYQFQVDIHMLWGNLLGGFAVFRFLTYVFLWLRPPRSILPSRPPTEAAAGFALMAGGMVFMLSVEGVTFAAMRSGWDDMMAFLNLTIATVCIVCTWIFVTLLVKGWAISRVEPSVFAAERARATMARLATTDVEEGEIRLSSPAPA